MLAGRPTATNVVRDGADAGELCDAGVEDGADRVIGVEEVPSTVLVRGVLDETVRAWAPLAVGTDDGDGDVESMVEVVAVEAVVAAVDVGVAAIGRARIVRAPVESTIAIKEAPIEATSAERRARTWGVERSAVVGIPLKLCPCAFMEAIFRNQNHGADYVFSTPCQINQTP
jgi:hypothetical protein